jgi:SnoaL-like domain
MALPVALVADLVRPKAGPAPARDRRPGSSAVWNTVRIYHSLWPLTGAHRIRAPLLPVDPSLKMGNPVGQYHAALRAGDLTAILGVFEPLGYAREPSGGPDGYFRGAEGLRAFYGDLFQSGAGIHLEYCTFTDDGVRGALEYQCVAWGRTRVSPQTGVAVYERGKSGKLSAARIYDDIAPAP